MDKMEIIVPFFALLISAGLFAAGAALAAAIAVRFGSVMEKMRRIEEGCLEIERSVYALEGKTKKIEDNIANIGISENGSGGYAGNGEYAGSGEHPENCGGGGGDEAAEIERIMGEKFAEGFSNLMSYSSREARRRRKVTAEYEGEK